ncbi:hypothetical protein BDW72DRAFT_213372 [Aspergillus terricola var. indicus]
MATQHKKNVVIVGGGIVGSVLAYFLSLSDDGEKVTVIERDFPALTARRSEMLTRLAVDSVGEYSRVPGGFDQVGGLEVAASTAGVENLKWWLKTARERDIKAELISAQKAAEIAQGLVKGDNVSALYFPADGTASPAAIRGYFQSQARTRGVEFLEGDVTQVCRGSGCVKGVMTSSGFIHAERVVLATGIWARSLCDFEIPIPVIPVAHPYMYGEYHEPKPYKPPFVRYPEHHVYVRDHGPYFGLGSYDHKLRAEKPNETAVGNWVEEFDTTFHRALRLIPEKTTLAPREKFNGIFSMMPDNMPLVGKIPGTEGLYMAAAVWITHAVCSARFLTEMIKGEPLDPVVKRALDPSRFGGCEMERLERESLHCYNSIYSTHEAI